MIQLRHQGIFAVGTLRSDRSRGCPIPTKQKMKKEGRGTICEFVEEDHNLVICEWYDNRRVLAISNFVGENPVSETRHCNRKNRKDLKVSRPAGAEIYNRYKGGVDKADTYFTFYRTKMHPTKWYHRTAFHLLSLAGVNSFVIYRHLGGTGSLLDFLTDVCRSLLLGQNNGNEKENIIPAKKVQSLKASEVPVSVSFDNIGHWPVKFTTNWCKLGLPLDGCSSRTKFICARCRVYLSLAKGGEKCFLDFHGID